MRKYVSKSSKGNLLLLCISNFVPYLRIVLFFFIIFLLPIHANSHEVITPFGDYCISCSYYGSCSKVLSHDEADQAIKEYYSSKGCTIGRIVHKGRFIVADILRNNIIIDRILFDRKTGRLRSIY